MKKLIISIFLLLSLTMSNAFTKSVEALDTNAFATDVNGYTLPDGKGFFGDYEYLKEDLSIPCIVVDFYYTEVNGEEVDFENNPNLYIKQISISSLPNDFYNEETGFKASHFECVKVLEGEWVILDNLLRNVHGDLLPNSCGSLMYSENNTMIKYTYYLTKWNNELSVWRPDFTNTYETALTISCVPAELLDEKYVGIYNGSFENVDVKEYEKKISISACPSLEFNPTGFEHIFGAFLSIGLCQYVVVYFSIQNLDYDTILSFSYEYEVWKRFLGFLWGVEDSHTIISETILADEVYERNESIIFLKSSYKFKRIDSNYENGFLAPNNKKYDHRILGGDILKLTNSSNTYTNRTGWAPYDKYNDNYFKIVELNFSYKGVIYKSLDIETINEAIPWDVPNFRDWSSSESSNDPSVLEKILEWLENNAPWVLRILKYLPTVILFSFIIFFVIKIYKSYKLKSTLNELKVKNKK